MIEVTDLSLRYGDATVVDRLSVTVKRGEVLVLLGQSGCGKTSAMRCIAGLEEPTGGSVGIDGRFVFDAATGTNVPPHKRNIGMVFQSYAIWPHRTVFENVAFAPKAKGLPADQVRKRAQEALQLVGLEHLASRGASQLSGGQMQRVALARSIAMQPQVLLLDEPLSNLDARLRERLRVELRAIQQRLGMTWVYVTHDQAEAFALADSVAVMEKGRIVQLGSPAEIYDRPLSASVAEFVGVANVLPCTVEEGGDGVVTARIQGTALHVQGISHGAQGPRMHACIRAEDIALAPAAQADPEASNQWAGRVAVVAFQGGTVTYQVAAKDGPLMHVVRPRREPAFALGDAVCLSVAPEQVAMVPPGDDA